MRLLFDEHLPPQIAAELRRRGHDAVAVVERPDLRRAPDEKLWATARSEGRVIVTQDISDFTRLAARDAAIAKRHPGLVLIHRRRFSRGGHDIGQLVEALDALVSSNPADHAMTDRVTWLKPEVGL